MSATASPARRAGPRRLEASVLRYARARAAAAGVDDDASRTADRRSGPAALGKRRRPPASAGRRRLSGEVGIIRSCSRRERVASTLPRIRPRRQTALHVFRKPGRQLVGRRDFAPVHLLLGGANQHRDLEVFGSRPPDGRTPLQPRLAFECGPSPRRSRTSSSASRVVLRDLFAVCVGAEAEQPSARFVGVEPDARGHICWPSGGSVPGSVVTMRRSRRSAAPSFRHIQSAR